MKKIAFITGSSQGVGLGIAVSLGEAGYEVLLNGRDEAKLKKSVENLKKKDIAADYLVGDVCDSNTRAQWLESIEKNYGKLDVLISNVGSGRTSNEAVVEVEEYRRVFEINFFSSVALVTDFLGVLKDSGSILMISSIAGVSAIGAPISYACAKASLLMFVKELSHRVADREIRVNAISPGNMMFEGSVWEGFLKERKEITEEYIKTHVPLNCFIDPSSVGDMALSIVSNPHMTGQNVVIDGGQVRGQS